MFIVFLVQIVTGSIFKTFEYVQVTSQLEYTAHTFKGVITLLPNSNNVLLWRCGNLEEAIPNVAFTLQQRGTILRLNDFNLQYQYQVSPLPQFIFDYQDASQGQLIIDYLTYRDTQYAENLKSIIDRVIIDEFTVDWESVHYAVQGLQDPLQQFCHKHEDFKMEL